MENKYICKKNWRSEMTSANFTKGKKYYKNGPSGEMINEDGYMVLFTGTSFDEHFIITFKYGK